MIGLNERDCAVCGKTIGRWPVCQHCGHVQRIFTRPKGEEVDAYLKQVRKEKGLREEKTNHTVKNSYRRPIPENSTSMTRSGFYKFIWVSLLLISVISISFLKNRKPMIDDEKGKVNVGIESNDTPEGWGRTPSETVAVNAQQSLSMTSNRLAEGESPKKRGFSAGIREFPRKIGDAFGRFFWNLWLMIAGFFSWIGEGFHSAGEWIGTLLYRIWAFCKNLPGAIWSGIIWVFSLLWRLILSIWHGIQWAGLWLWGLLIGMLMWIGNVFIWIGRGIVNGFVFFGEAIGTGLFEIVEKLGDTSESLGDALGQGIHDSFTQGDAPQDFGEKH